MFLYKMRQVAFSTLYRLCGYRCAQSNEMRDRMLNEAFGIFQEFGPKRAIPRDVRLRACFPSLSDDQILDLIAQFEGIESFAYDVAEQVRDKLIEQSEGVSRLASQFPILNDERLSRTFSQAMYFSMK